MQVIFQCPVCGKTSLALLTPRTAAVRCSCGWLRDAGSSDFSGENLRRCRVCGCEDLWRQKDFPPALGIVFVGMGVVLSSIAWAWHLPLVALGVLMGFALVDLILYALMRDMLVCYRCRARHRKTELDDLHPKFRLEVAERYRQQERRKSNTADAPEVQHFGESEGRR